LAIHPEHITIVRLCAPHRVQQLKCTCNSTAFGRSVSHPDSHLYVRVFVPHMTFRKFLESANTESRSGRVSGKMTRANVIVVNSCLVQYGRTRFADLAAQMRRYLEAHDSTLRGRQALWPQAAV